ncbi:sigma-70 family RNA polymerase sigma factor [Phycisphaeraceae bacterium D3-23]
MTDPQAASESAQPPAAGAGDRPEGTPEPSTPPAEGEPAPAIPAPPPLDFAKTLKVYEPRLLRYAARLLGPGVPAAIATQAEPGRDTQPADLVQEAFLRLHRHCRSHGSASIEHPGTWLYRVVHNLALDTIRKRTRQRVALPRLEHDARRRADDAGREDDDALGQLEHREQVELALRLLHDLPERQQQVITLKLLDGLTLRQVAEVMDASPGSVNYHLNQGLQRLAQQLRQKGAV